MSQAKSVDGVAIYAKPYNEDKFGKFTIDLVPAGVSESQEKTLLLAGIQPARNKMKELVSHQEALGIDGLVFKFARKSKDKNGVAKTPPKVVDSAGKDTTVAIGNGSKVRVFFNSFKNSEGGTSTELLGIQILELVRYEPKARIETPLVIAPVAGGFVDDGTAPTVTIDDLTAPISDFKKDILS